MKKTAKATVKRTVMISDKTGGNNNSYNLGGADYPPGTEQWALLARSHFILTH